MKQSLALSSQLSVGQRVRVTWSGKLGVVITPHLPRKRGRNSDGGGPSALVRLDPFACRFGQEYAVVRGLEGIYQTRDLEVLDG